MLENQMLNDELIDIEVNHILLLFKKNNYTLKQKKWFLQSKLMDLKKRNDPVLLEVCKKVNEIINKEKE